MSHQWVKMPFEAYWELADSLYSRVLTASISQHQLTADHRKLVSMIEGWGHCNLFTGPGLRGDECDVELLHPATSYPFMRVSVFRQKVICAEFMELIDAWAAHATAPYYVPVGYGPTILAYDDVDDPLYFESLICGPVRIVTSLGKQDYADFSRRIVAQGDYIWISEG